MNGDKRFPYLPDEHVVEVERGPQPGGPKGAYRAFGETLTVPVHGCETPICAYAAMGTWSS